MKRKHLGIISFIFFLSFLVVFLVCPDGAFSQGGISGRQSQALSNMIGFSGMIAPTRAWRRTAIGRLNLGRMTSRARLMGGTYNMFARMSRAGRLGNFQRMDGYMGMGGFRGVDSVASSRRAYGLGLWGSRRMRGLAGIRFGGFDYGLAGMLNITARRGRKAGWLLGGTYARRKKRVSSFRNLFTARVAGRRAYQRLPRTYLRGRQGISLNPYLNRARKKKTTVTDLTRKRSLRLY